MLRERLLVWVDAGLSALSAACTPGAAAVATSHTSALGGASTQLRRGAARTRLEVADASGGQSSSCSSSSSGSDGRRRRSRSCSAILRDRCQRFSCGWRGRVVAASAELLEGCIELREGRGRVRQKQQVPQRSEKPSSLRPVAVLVPEDFVRSHRQASELHRLHGADATLPRQTTRQLLRPM